MNSTRYGLLATITVFSACGTLLSPIVAQGQEEQVSQETEVLTRGPVHEAFAETVSFEPEAGILISTQPPEAIDELPPEQELEGDNVVWIAGYWAWDEDLNDFMWVSGVWRNVPPDREWVPGYWNEVGSQWQWVSGYWADAGTEEVAYLPEPPKTLERGPSSAAPDDDDVWVPGTWVYVDTRYRWRPGYWQPYRQNWAYVPDRYTWTPRGYVYVAGYWDYPVVSRGIIFAPVRFHRPVWREPHFHYTPFSVININVVVNHLFVRPRYGHYYFGDYYEPRYVDRGFYSSVTYATTYRRGFDPIFSYQRWEHRHDRDWERRRLADYDYFRDNRDARPPRTWADLRDVGDGRRGFKNREGKDMAIATPLPVFAKRAEAGETDGPKQRFKELNQASREKIVNQRQELRNFRQQRKQIEKEAPAPVAKAEEGQPAPVVKPSKAKFQRSPVVGRKAAQLSPDQAPPKRKAAPAVAEKDPTPDEAAKPDDKQPDQPRRPGRGQGGKGQGGTADDEKKPDMTPEPKPKKEDEATPEREPKVKPQPQPQRDPKVRPQPQPKKEDSTEREPKEKPDPQPKPEREPKVKPQPQPQPEREPKVKPQPQPQPEREPKVKPQPQPKREQTQPEPKRERVQPQPQPQPKREVQPQPQPKRERVQPEPKKKEEVQAQPKRPQAQPQQQRERVQPQPQQPKREQAQPQPQRQRVQPQGGGGGKGGRGKAKEEEEKKKE